MKAKLEANDGTEKEILSFGPFTIDPDYQRKGYGSEALSAVIENAFAEGVHRIYAECDPRNICSWKLLEKVGLVREAHFRQNVFFHRDENGMPKWKYTYVYAKVL